MKRLAAMTCAHLDEVLAIERVSFPTPWTKAAFNHEIMNNEFACYIVALDGNKVIGYCGMWVIVDEAHITTLAVHPDYRRQGIAREMLKEMCNEALYRGCRRMTLEVRLSNHGAIKLYEKVGFVSCGLRPGYYTDTKEDAIIMWKDDLKEV